MTVSITDTRTTIDQADTTTGWTFSNGSWAAGSTVFVESTQSFIGTLNIATGQAYFTSSTRNVSNTLIYIWADNFALKGDWTDANPPTALFLGDGTNQISFKMSGANRKVFAHLSNVSGGTGEARVDWECLVLDGSQASAMNTAGNTVARAGSFGSLNLSAITQFGVDFTTLSKGLGGGVNVAVDIIRIGNDGLIITGGAVSTEGKFSEIVAADRSTADLTAYGIIREYSTGIYGVQGPLTFGGTATGTTLFEDADRVVIFEDRNISDDKYYIKVQEPTVSGTTTFTLDNSTITTAGPNITGTFNSAGITSLTITDCNFSQWGNTITFANDAAASGHTVTGNTFSNCGQIDPGDVTFQNNTISNSADSATGAVLLDADGTSNWSGLTFNSGGTGHAIQVTAAGTYTFTNFTYNGYSTSNETTDSGVNNTSLGLVTINVSGGGSPTYKNSDFGANSAKSFNANTTTFTDETTDINSSTANDVTLVPIQTTTAGDIFYFGNSSTFSAVSVNVGTAGSYSDITLNWEYWNGSTWSALSVTDNTTGFTVTGHNAIFFTAPGDWASTTVDSSNLFWIRVRTTFGVSPAITTAPLGTEGGVGAVIVQNAVTIQITGVTEGARCRIENASTGVAYLSAEANSSGVASTSLNHPGGNITVNVKARLVGYLPFETTTTWEDGANLSVGAVWQVDRISDTIDFGEQG